MPSRAEPAPSSHTAAHEIGHLLGLHHVLGISDIMYGRFDIGATRDLGFCRGQVVLEDGLVPFLFQDPEHYLSRVAGAGQRGTIPSCYPVTDERLSAYPVAR